MVDVHNKRCDHPKGCGKSPGYGMKGGRATRCNAHKEPGMVDVSNKRCAHP